MTLKTYTSLLMCLITVTVATSNNETTPEASEKEAETELTYTVPYYDLTPLRTGVLVLSLGVITMLILYLPAMLYRMCVLLGGCQAQENRIKRDQFIASQLGAARDIRFSNDRSVSAGPILASLARAHKNYA